MYKTFGIVLTVLLMVMAFNNAAYYLLLANIGIWEWLLFFPNNLVILLFCLGYLLNNKTILAFTIPVFLYLGIFGLITFMHRSDQLAFQIGHLVMLLAVVWVIYGIFKEKKFKEATIGLICAAFIGNGFLAFEQHYIYQKHWGRFNEVLKFQPKKKVFPAI
jgi:hypothetical protein